MSSAALFLSSSLRTYPQGPADSGLGIVRDFYLYVSDTMPALIPGILLVITAALLFLAWKMRRAYLPALVPFLAGKKGQTLLLTNR